MQKILGTCVTFIGGTLGWYAGAMIGTTTAFVVSMVGTGLGIYFARRVIRELGV